MQRPTTIALRAGLGVMIFVLGNALFSHAPNSPYAGASLAMRIAGGTAVGLVMAAPVALLTWLFMRWKQPKSDTQ